MSILREYLGRSSFHGLHYLVDPGLHWSERVFWLLCVLACWGGSVYLMLSWIDFAYHNPVSLSLDNDYLNWNTPIPGLIVCETNSLKLLAEKNLVIRERMQQNIFFAYYLSGEVNNNYSEKMWLYKNHRSNCSELFNYCSWQNIEFDCCTYFLPIETPMGTCFSMNTIQNVNTGWDTFKYIQREHGIVILEFQSPCVKVYAISNDEIATESQLPIFVQDKFGLYIEYKIFLSLTETVSEPEIREVDVERRKCRFSDENYLNVSRKYSFNACKLQCQKDMHLKLFNCTHHYMPFTDEKDICTEKQLIKLLKGSREWRHMAEQNCKCELSCIFNEVLFLGRNVVTERTVNLKHESTATVWLSYRCKSNFYGNRIERVKESNYLNIEFYVCFKRLKNNSTWIHAHIDIVATSTKRTRKMAHNMLSNIVNVGGTAGLFVGASLLSVVEIIYYFTIRALGTILMEKIKRRRIEPKITVSEPIHIEVYPFVN